MLISVYEPIFKKMDRGEVPSLLRAQSLFCNMGMVTLLSLQCCWGFSEVGYVSVLTLWVFAVTAAYYIIQHHILYIILYNITYYTAHLLKNKNPNYIWTKISLVRTLFYGREVPDFILHLDIRILILQSLSNSFLYRRIDEGFSGFHKLVTNDWEVNIYIYIAYTYVYKYCYIQIYIFEYIYIYTHTAF